MSKLSEALEQLNTKQRQRNVRGRQVQERVYAVACPQCQQERWLKKWDALKALAENRLCHRCSQSKKGKKGWQTTCARYGHKAVVRHVQAYRLANPSNLEREIMLILDELGLPYSREVWCEEAQQVYLIDFVISTALGDLAIEVNGAYYHRQRQSEDALKAAALKYCGYRVLILHEASIQAGEARTQILNALNSPNEGKLQ